MSVPMLLALATLAAPPALDAERVYSPLDTSDLEDLARRLLLHVPLIEVKLPRGDIELLMENPRTGYGAVLSARRVVCLSFLVDGGEAVTLVGPRGRTRAKVLYMDHETRFAMLEAERDLSQVGLHPVAGWVPPSARKVAMPVFSLVSTLELSGVSQGVLTHLGTLREYEGHLRVDLKLERGMPVFDDRARLLGLSRVVAWDQDRYMLIPPEKLRTTKTSTGASAPPPTPKKEARPWWAK